MDEGRLLTGREMIRIIVDYHAVRSEHGQIYTITDLQKVVISNENNAKADAELPYFYNEWLDIWNGLGEAPHSSVMPAIQEHFYKQVKKCPVMKMALVLYDFCTDPIGTGPTKTYDWLLEQVRRLMDRDRLDDNRDTQTDDLESRMKRKRNDPAAPATAGSNPTNKAGVPLSQILCNKFKKGACNTPNCQFSHSKKLLGQAKAKAKAKAKPAAAAPQQPTIQYVVPPIAGFGSDWQRPVRARGPGTPGREAAPAPNSGRSNKTVCFAYSRGACKGKNATPPCTREHRKLTPPEEAQRDAWEASMLAAGRQLPYVITNAAVAAKVQANAAAAASAAPATGKGKGKGAPKGGKGKGAPKGKGKGSGKGKGGPCNQFMNSGTCTYGANCHFKANTPGHP